MIPVLDSALIQINIENIPDENYKRLLQNQYTSILADKAQIQKCATNLHTLVSTSDANLNSYDLTIKQRSCNLPLLESIFTQYKP